MAFEEYYSCREVVAYRGTGNRVHETEAAAINDVVSNKMASSEWTKVQINNDKLNIPFNAVIEAATDNIEVFERIIAFARWRKEHGIS